MSVSHPARISSIEELEAVYGPPLARSLDKELDHISDFYRAFIERAPFLVLATVGPEGTDCSPRGDPPGFVRVADRRTVMLPDRRGNNRIDSLRNIVRDPRVSLLFLVPGVGETLRINGTAEIVTDAALCESFAMGEKAPRSVIVVTVGSVYYQCQKALVRSKLWDPASIVPRHELPSAGQMLQSMLDVPGFSGDEYDRNYPEHMKKTIY
ncbi:MAG: pyridoxamine 5'-phosphate oxidase family protein [Pseudomonadota bacterium]|nr:pyridoxamine 5'-phosphate oxidase family protein [Pseudomonadota bacterium]